MEGRRAREQRKTDTRVRRAGHSANLALAVLELSTKRQGWGVLVRVRVGVSVPDFSTGLPHPGQGLAMELMIAWFLTFSESERETGQTHHTRRRAWTKPKQTSA